MQRRTDRARDVALGDRGEEIGLALDCGSDLALGERRARGHAPHGVGPSHHGAAVHDAAPVAELLANYELGLAALRGSLDQLEAHELAESHRLPVCHRIPRLDFALDSSKSHSGLYAVQAGAARLSAGLRQEK